MDHHIERVVDLLEPSLNHLEQQLADATRAYNELRDLISKLEMERQAASRELTNCEIDLTSAIGDHLQHADEVEALFLAGVVDRQRLDLITVAGRQRLEAEVQPQGDSRSRRAVH